MSDQDLRRLERAFARNPSAAACLRFAGALDRTGEKDRAVDVLLEGEAEPAVRAEVVARIGRSELGDPPPVERAPRVVWAVSIDGKVSGFTQGPLAAVVESSKGPASILDPATGRRISRIRELPGLAAVDGDRILAHDEGSLLVFDATTGHVAAKHATKRGTRSEAYAPGSMATLTERELTVYRQEGLAAPVELWSRKAPRTGLWNGFVAIAGDRVHSGTVSGRFFDRREHVTFALATGKVLATVEGGGQGRADPAGAWIWTTPRPGAVGGTVPWRLVDARGRVLFEDGAARYMPRVLGTDFVVAEEAGADARTTRTVVLSRADGSVRADLGTSRVAVHAAARDVVYVAAGGTKTERTITAFSSRGEELWRTGVATKHPIGALVPGWRCLYAIVGMWQGKGRVFCLGAR
jgi:hypothetical protein